MAYFDEKGNIRAELLNEEAREFAKSFVPLRFNRRKNKEEPTDDAIKNSQLRRFFGEFKSLQRQLEQRQGDQEEKFLSIRPLIKMANAKVAYAKARKVVPDAFAGWLKEHVLSIETAKDFGAFMYHFEAIIGFCYERNPKD